MHIPRPFGSKVEVFVASPCRTQAEGRGWLRGGIPVSFPLPAEGAAGAEGRDAASLGSLVRGMPWRVVSTWADGDAFAEVGHRTNAPTIHNRCPNRRSASLIVTSCFFVRSGPL